MTASRKIQETKPLRCRVHGRVEARLGRVDHSVSVEGGNIVVENVAAWVCPTCSAVLAVPHEAAGRIAAALQAQADRTVQEVRVSLELEDLALGVNAALGMAGVSDPFTLPVHLGLQLVGDRQVPASSWQRFDGLKKAGGRARPLLHPDTRQRLEGLARLWGTDVSDVIRWLTVLAADAMLAGLTTTVMRDDSLYAETSAIDVATLDQYPVARIGPATTTPVSPVTHDINSDLAAAA